ncbi:hypothetical protein PHET_12098 [Paragonimus heterotremus]|uniref:Uncharacterized protein n=1 Tax=Paragonimus heterotremus TaxID=100268 RepID=A0A8J4SYB5_9TREM|nr:hypothetical protein PHET_12098 [Paragonimus heterotremus]
MSYAKLKSELNSYRSANGGTEMSQRYFGRDVKLMVVFEAASSISSWNGIRYLITALETYKVSTISRHVLFGSVPTHSSTGCHLRPLPPTETISHVTLRSYACI